MKVAGVIIAGGKSSRMGGSEKALLAVGGSPLIQRVVERIRPQVDMLAINANGDAKRFDCFGLPVIADRLPVGTPLAGLEAALHWASHAGADLLLTVPSDAPSLPPDLVARLASANPAIATSGGREHYLTAVWPTGLHALLVKAIQQDGLRAVRDFARFAEARHVEWTTDDCDPFINLNSPEDVLAFLKHEQHHART